MAERQTNYTIGEIYELPSRGAIYDVPVNPIIELRSMNGRDELKRQNPDSNCTQFKKLADIIEGCCIEKPAIHVYDMCLADYTFLLHRLRVITYEAGYDVHLICPFCKADIDTVADLDSLPFKDLDVEALKEKMIIQLPKCGKTVKLKLQTPRMLDENAAKAKELKRKYKTADIAIDELVLVLSIIDTVDGEKLDQSRLETFIYNLNAMDLKLMIKREDEINSMFGIVNDLVVDCPNCGGEVHTSFRYGAEFFGPASR